MLSYAMNAFVSDVQSYWAWNDYEGWEQNYRLFRKSDAHPGPRGLFRRDRAIAEPAVEKSAVVE